MRSDRNGIMAFVFALAFVLALVWGMYWHQKAVEQAFRADVLQTDLVLMERGLVKR
jgi:hypothetical protein